MRELKIGDRVVHWRGETGVVISAPHGYEFTMRFDHDGSQRPYGWIEFDPTNPDDIAEPAGTFRFEDTEYPEWPL